MVSNHFLALYYRSWLMKTYLINAFASVVLQRIIEFHLYPMNNSTFNRLYHSFQNQNQQVKNETLNSLKFPSLSEESSKISSKTGILDKHPKTCIGNFDIFSNTLLNYSKLFFFSKACFEHSILFKVLPLRNSNVFQEMKTKTFLKIFSLISHICKEK